MSNVRANDFLLTPSARKLIRFKARQLCRRRDFCMSEFDDLQQHLWLAVIRAGAQFDETKASLDTFIDRVVDATVKMLLRSRQRIHQLGGLRKQSLESEISPVNDAPEILSDTVSYDDLSRRTGAVSLNEVAHREDCEAIQNALTKMPEELRDLCELLMLGTVNSTAKDLGTSRRRTRRLMRQAKQCLREEGFDF